jgi:hypothetical protein
MQYVDEYAALLSNWPGAYTCAVYSYLGLNTPQGPRLLHGKIVFEPFKSEIEADSSEFKTAHIFAGRFVKSLSPNGVAAIIESAKEGHMEGVGNLPPDERASSRFSPYSMSDYHPLVAKLFIRGAARHQIQGNLPRYIDWEMKTGDTPFDTLNELLADYGLPQLAPGTDAATLELVANAPAQIIIGHSAIKSGNCVIECRIAKALDIGKVKIGCRIFQKADVITRQSARGDTFEWSERPEHKVGRCHVSGVNAPVLEAYLSYDGIPLDQSSVVDPDKHLNSRYAIHQLFDPTTNSLRDMLLPAENDKGKNFEGAVAILLTLLGFSVSHYGHFPKLREGADIIAATLSGHTAVVECTTGLLSQKNHIAKLVTRAHSIREKLDNSGYTGVRVQPVIVTSLSRGRVEGDLEVAKEHRVAVLCREDLENALNRVALRPNAEQFFGNFEKLIPAARHRF